MDVSEWSAIAMVAVGGFRQEAAMAATLEDSGLQGMVPWEAGNARYLQTAVGAKVGDVGSEPGRN